MNSLSMPLVPLHTETTTFYETIKAIERHVSAHSLLPRFSRWQLGTTDDPGALLLQLQQADSLQHWQVWEVTNRVAWSLQNYFRGRSMQTSGTPETSDAAARYLYLFKPRFSVRSLWQSFYRG